MVFRCLVSKYCGDYTGRNLERIKVVGRKMLGSVIRDGFLSDLGRGFRYW